MTSLLATFVLLAATLPAHAQTALPMVWNDEFTGPANTPPDASKWVFDLGRGPNGNGWGNNELETYTNSLGNAHLDGNGHLVIRASASPYTSARLKTLGKFTTTYGKIEARIQIPRGQGIWPAFWMLGADLATAGWPACGEIDIMENIGREPSIVHATVHGPGYSGGSGITSMYSQPAGHAFADDFHVFAVVWSPQSLEFFVDSVSVSTVTPASLPAGAHWVFNKPFFLLLNLAVGGNWPGNPDSSTQFPQDMVVDYVRVYSSPALSAPSNLNVIPK